MNYSDKDYSHIKGWGIDADPENDPTYPMRQPRTDEEQNGYSWNRPTLQVVDREILHSIERPNLTAVFGTSTPPSGLSGVFEGMHLNLANPAMPIGCLLHWLTG